MDFGADTSLFHKVPPTSDAPLRLEPMSDEHMAALSQGRVQGRAVKNYLEALAALNKPAKRGRRRTPESIEQRLAKITDDMRGADPLQRLQLVQEQLDLTDELAELRGAGPELDMEAIEAAFIEHAGAYSEAKGIVYAAWRVMGVAPQMLRSAGIRR